MCSFQVCARRHPWTVFILAAEPNPDKLQTLTAVLPTLQSLSRSLNICSTCHLASLLYSELLQPVAYLKFQRESRNLLLSEGRTFTTRDQRKIRFCSSPNVMQTGLHTRNIETSLGLPHGLLHTTSASPRINSYSHRKQKQCRIRFGFQTPNAA